MEVRSIEAIVTALNTAQAQYLIVGDLAVAAHGYQRLTADVDLVIGLQPENVTRALHALFAIGYQPSIPVSAEDPAQVADPGRSQLSDAELAIALLSAAQIYSPWHIRCAAQMLGTPGLDPAQLARLARMERCTLILRQIAEAALRYDPGQTTFWRQILTQLPTTPLPPPGVLPHPSRYVSLSGLSRPGHPPSTSAVWLRPVLAP